MQFTLRFLLLAFVLIAVCMAIFDWAGLVIGLMLTGCAAYARGTRTAVRVALSALLVFMLGFSVQSLLPAIGAARFAARRTANIADNLKPVGSQVGLALRSYRDRFGSLPPVQERDSQGQPRHSWRVLILQGDALGTYGHELTSRYNRDEAWNGPNNRKLAAEYPGTALFLAVVSEDGDWLRPTADSNPVQLIEARGVSIPWLEPRDLTVDEACQAIYVPPLSGSLAHRLLGLEKQDTLTVLADGDELRIPVHTPPSVVRAALLGDRATQRVVEWYRDASRQLRWFDYLTLAGLVACWCLMIQPWPRRRPAEMEEGESFSAPEEF